MSARAVALCQSLCVVPFFGSLHIVDPMPSSSPRVLDAIVIGAGPSGLGASIALSGWRPHYVPRCPLEDRALERRLSAESLVSASRSLTAGLSGRSNNPLALLFDALQHPGVDRGSPQPSCLQLRRDPSAALTHVFLDASPPGGAWHAMHEATRTLSPGPWMELPGFALADFLRARAPALTAKSAAAAAAMRQPRRLIAEYYVAAASHFDVQQHHRPWRAASVRRARDGDAGADGGGAAAWIVESADGTTPPLLARSVVLAVGTAGVPRKLGIEGEELPMVSHKCAALPDEARSVLVVGAGLSAADCIVHLLGQGKTVLHAFRGDAETTKVGSKFGSPGAQSFYPEYHALVRAMKSNGPAQLLGGRYEALAGAELKLIREDGTCNLSRGAREGSAVNVQAVGVMIGASPDLSFLAPPVREALEGAGVPRQLSAEGVKATHEVFIDVDPYTMETEAVPGLFALGPLRGDNFARFALHDGHGVAEALRERRAESEDETECAEIE